MDKQIYYTHKWDIGIHKRTAEPFPSVVQHTDIRFDILAMLILWERKPKPKPKPKPETNPNHNHVLHIRPLLASKLIALYNSRLAVIYVISP